MKVTQNENYEFQKRQHKAQQDPQLHEQKPGLSNNKIQKDTRL